MVSCLIGFIFSANANCVTGLYHAWEFDDGFFTFSCCKNDPNNTVNFSDRISFGAFEILSALCMMYWQTNCFLNREAAFLRKCTSVGFLARSSIKFLCPCPYVSQCSRPLILSCNVVRDSYSFFLFIFTWGNFCGLRRDLFARGNSLGR